MNTINPAWNEMIIKAVNSHFSYQLKERRHLNVYYQNQADPDFGALPHWIKLSVFGPAYEYHNRDISATVSVQLRVFLKKSENLYDLDRILGQLAEAATTPVKIPDLNKCLRTLTVTTTSKGRITHSQAALAGEVVVTYDVQLEE